MAALEIEKMIYGGDALARLEGKSIFVPFALPGEKVEATLQDQRRSFARAEITTIERASEHRVLPECPYFGRCGGCHYQHADYAAQLAMKSDILRETLRRTGGIELEVPLQVVASPEPWHYRNRTRMHVAHQPTFRMGYYRAGSHELMQIAVCPISSRLLNRVIASLQQIGDAGAVLRRVTEIELFANAADDECLVEVYGASAPSEKEFAAFAAALRSASPQCAGVHMFVQSSSTRGQMPILHYLFGEGARALHYRVGEDCFQVSAGSFFQVNRCLLERFVETVIGDSQGQRALDLYAGAGLFAAPLLRRFREVIAVEVSPVSYNDLQSNLPGHAQTCRLTTEDFFRSRVKLARGCDLAIVDPPRAGLGPETARLLATSLPRQITYVSCDPATLARDLRVLLESGYRIGEAHLVDMFPQTFHIESVIRLHSSRHES